jgi:hypothetical protein
MRSSSPRNFTGRQTCFWILALIGAALAVQSEPLLAAGPPPAYNREHPITIDPTPLVPQSWWQVPGITPPLWVLDPETSDAYRTTETRELKLKPGQYKFISFTFDFPFTVSLDGKLVRCKRTYPHGGQRDAYYGNSEVGDGTGTR